MCSVASAGLLNFSWEVREEVLAREKDRMAIIMRIVKCRIVKLEIDGCLSERTFLFILSFYYYSIASN